jgi:hypothetical protein
MLLAPKFKSSREFPLHHFDTRGIKTFLFLSQDSDLDTTITSIVRLLVVTAIAPLSSLIPCPDLSRESPGGIHMWKKMHRITETESFG